MYSCTIFTDGLDLCIIYLLAIALLWYCIKHLKLISDPYPRFQCVFRIQSICTSKLVSAPHLLKTVVEVKVSGPPYDLICVLLLLLSYHRRLRMILRSARAARGRRSG